MQKGDNKSSKYSKMLLMNCEIKYEVNWNKNCEISGPSGRVVNNSNGVKYISLQ